MKNIDFNKILQYEDTNSTVYSVFNSQYVTFGDDVYHSHALYEIVYLLNGSIKHFLNEQPFDLMAGDILFLRPEDKHCYLRDESNTTIAHRDLFFRLDFFEEVCQFLGKDYLENYKKDPMPLKIHLPLDRLIALEKKVERYYKIPSIKEKKLYAKFFLIELLGIRMESFTPSNIQNEKYPGWLNALLQRMHIVEYYKLGLPVILSFFNLERSYMCRTFKKYMHVTMTDYLNNLRLDYTASQLLLTPNSILNIAFESGFSSVAYFSRLFKKRFGCSPSEYRKKATPNI